PNALEATGFTLVIISFLMVYTFRGDLHFDFLRAYGWYDAIPQVGAVLFVAGWWTALRTPLRPKRPLTSRGLVSVAGLAVVLLVLNVPRADRIFVGWAGLSGRESGRHEALAVASRRAEHQRSFLARLDRAEQIAAREGIGRRAIRAVFGRVIGPGV